MGSQEEKQMAQNSWEFRKEDREGGYLRTVWYREEQGEAEAAYESGHIMVDLIVAQL